MAEIPESGYFVDRVGKVVDQIRVLVQRRIVSGQQTALASAWTSVLGHLRRDPAGWGDPLYRTQLEGGMICRGIVPPLIVRYVVYEPERIVWILDVQPLPGHPLAQN